MSAQSPTPDGTTSSSQPAAASTIATQRAVDDAAGNWKLPVGIEGHIEDGVIKLTAGVLIGGTVGMLLFKSGKGWRAASIASGVGVAIGSSYVRYRTATTTTATSATKPIDATTTAAAARTSSPMSGKQ
jgi:Domain of unknown function (DUF543)